MYPQGCDVCNHLSLFLCVADYDKLLPGVCIHQPCIPSAVHLIITLHVGWSHFAQFTIAVVNKDPKKSKYSGTHATAQRVHQLSRGNLSPYTTDTLHRFCKKEHDWGWKKFMELSKILEGFTVQDTLVIKAQVQVIR